MGSGGVRLLGVGLVAIAAVFEEGVELVEEGVELFEEVGGGLDGFVEVAEEGGDDEDPDEGVGGVEGDLAGGGKLAGELGLAGLGLGGSVVHHG